MVTIHSPGALPRASSAMRSWISRIERTRPSEGNTLRSASRSMWAWPSVMPGMTGRLLRSMMRVAGPACAAIASSGPTARMRSPAMATAEAMVNAGSTVMTLPFLKMMSAAAVAGRADTGCAAAGADTPLASTAAAAVAVPAAPAPVRKPRRGMASIAAPPSCTQPCWDARPRERSRIPLRLSPAPSLSP